MQPTITPKPAARAASRSASASVRPPVLSSLMFTMSYLPASPAETGPVVATFVGTDRQRSARSRPEHHRPRQAMAARPDSTPSRTRCGARSAYTSAVQPSFASTMIRARGAPSRTASSRGMSSGAPSLIFSNGRAAWPRLPLHRGGHARQGEGGDHRPGSASPAIARPAARPPWPPDPPARSRPHCAPRHAAANAAPNPARKAPAIPDRAPSICAVTLSSVSPYRA